MSNPVVLGRSWNNWNWGSINYNYGMTLDVSGVSDRRGGGCD